MARMSDTEDTNANRIGLGAAEIPVPQAAKPNHAFGVDPARRHFYSLRQSRYEAIAQDVSDWAGTAARAGRPFRLLDVGCGTGVLLRYLEAKPHFADMEISGANLVDRDIYKREIYQKFYVGDIMNGYDDIKSEYYDAVVCEQLLEHLPDIQTAAQLMARVLKPRGKLIVGVPIFLPPIHLLRIHVIPRLDRIFVPSKSRGHLQAFSRRSFVGLMTRHSGLRVLKVRGFRVISGGLLKPLEHYRWWWRLNRRIGALVPAACIEIQAIMEKPAPGE